MSHVYLPYVIREIKLDEVLKLEPDTRIIDVKFHKISSNTVGCEVIVDKYLVTPLVLIDAKGNIVAITGFYIVYDEDSRELVVLDLKFNRIQKVSNVVRIYKLSYNSVLIVCKEDVKLLVMDNMVRMLKIDVDSESELIKYIGNKAYLGLLFMTKKRNRHCIIVDTNKVQVVSSIYSKVIDLACSDEEMYVCYMRGKKIILKRLPHGNEVQLNIKRVKYLELSINGGFLTLNYISCDEEYTLVLNRELGEVLKVKKKGLLPLYGELNEVYIWDPVSGITFAQVDDKRIPLIKCNDKPHIFKRDNKLYVLCNSYLHEVCKQSWRPIARVNKAFIYDDYIINFNDTIIEVFKIEDSTFKIVLRKPDSHIILDKKILILRYGLRILVVDTERIISTSSILVEDLYNSNKPVLAHISVYIPRGLIIDNIEVQNARFKTYRVPNGFEILIYELRYISEASLIANEIDYIDLKLKLKSMYLANDLVMNFKVKLKKPIVLIKRRPLVIYCEDGSIKIGNEYYGGSLLWMRMYALNPLPRSLTIDIRMIIGNRPFNVGNITIKGNSILETDTYLEINFSEDVKKLIDGKDIKVILIIREREDIVVGKTNGIIITYENPIDYVNVSKKPIEFEPYSATYKVIIKLKSHTDLVHVFAEGGLKGFHKFYLEPGKHELVVRFAPRPSNPDTSINVRCIKYVNSDLNIQLSWTYTFKLYEGDIKISFKVLNSLFKKEELRHDYIYLPIYLSDKLNSYGFITAISVEDNRVLTTVCIRSGFNEIKIPLTDIIDYKNKKSIPIILDYFNGVVCIRRIVFINVIECPIRKIVPIIRPCNKFTELILVLDNAKNDVRVLLHNIDYDYVVMHGIKYGVNYIKVQDIRDFRQFEFIVYIVYNNMVWERLIKVSFDVRVGLLLAYNSAKVLYNILNNRM